MKVGLEVFGSGLILLNLIAALFFNQKGFDFGNDYFLGATLGVGIMSLVVWAKTLINKERVGEQK